MNFPRLCAPIMAWLWGGGRANSERLPPEIKSIVDFGTYRLVDGALTVAPPASLAYIKAGSG
jgi:hypothetical protein